MKFTLKIESGDAAFEDFPEGEVARILRHVADLVKAGYRSAPLLDINGNRVGEYRYEEDEA